MNPRQTPVLMCHRLGDAHNAWTSWSAVSIEDFDTAWNEWAEGNYVEPDQKWGRAYLDVIKEEVTQGD